MATASSSSSSSLQPLSAATEATPAACGPGPRRAVWASPLLLASAVVLAPLLWSPVPSPRLQWRSLPAAPPWPHRAAGGPTRPPTPLRADAGWGAGPASADSEWWASGRPGSGASAGAARQAEPGAAGPSGGYAWAAQMAPQLPPTQRRRFVPRPMKSLVYTRLAKQARAAGERAVRRVDVLDYVWEALPDAEDAAWLAEDLMRDGNVPATLAVLRYMEKNKVVGRPEFYGQLLQALALMDAPRDAFIALGYALRGGGVDDVSCSRVVWKFATDRHWREALLLLQEVRQRDVRLSLNAYAAVIAAADRARRPDLVIEAYKEMHRQRLQGDSQTFSIVLRCYDEVVGWQAALDVFSDIRQPLAVHYNTVLAILAATGQADTAWHLFAEMRPSGVVPDAVTYTLLLRASAQAGDWQQAEAVFQDLEAAGLPPTAGLYGALLQAYVAEGQWQRALARFEAMGQAGVQPGPEAYDALLACLAVAGHAEAVLLLFQEMVDGGVPPSPAAYGHAVRALWALGRAAEAEAVLAHMKAAGVVRRDVALPQLLALNATAAVAAAAVTPTPGQRAALMRLVGNERVAALGEDEAGGALAAEEWYHDVYAEEEEKEKVAEEEDEGQEEVEPTT